MKRTALIVVALVGVFSYQSTFAQQGVPVPKTGSCPGGYYTSGTYCVPNGDHARHATPKTGSCPSGYYTSGNYCR